MGAGPAAGDSVCSVDWRGLGSDLQEGEGMGAVQLGRSSRGSHGFRDLPPSAERETQVYSVWLQSQTRKAPRDGMKGNRIWFNLRNSLENS